MLLRSCDNFDSVDALWWRANSSAVDAFDGVDSCDPVRKTSGYAEHAHLRHGNSRMSLNARFNP